MNTAQIIDHFDRICDAPGAIPRLRRFILGLAVYGKLVEQDPNDEPANELLKRILEKKASFETNKTKKRKTETMVNPGENPFELPHGWTNAPLAEVTAVINGRAYSRNELLNSGTPVLRVGNLFTSKQWYYSNLRLEDEKYCDAGDLLFAWSASFGPFIWPGPKAIYHYHIWKLRLHSDSDLDKFYLYNFLRHKTQEIKDSGHGVSMIHMTKEKMEEVVVPVPPLAEQHRIVAKIDELMALCDRLETAQTHRENRRDKLVAASLHRLNNGADGDEFREHSRFHLRHLPRLTTRPEHIQQLRQTILNLAVRGRFFGVGPGVSGDGNKVGDFVKFLNGYAFESKSFQKNGVRLCRNVNVSHGALNWRSDNTACVSESAAADFQRYNLSEGDIVLSLDRPLISTGLKVAKVKYEDLPCLLLQRVGKAELLSTKINLDYFMLWLQSAYFMTAIDPGRSKGVPHISTRQVESLAFTPPLLSEQNRIVAKVEKLLPLCDRLEAQVTTTETESRRLLEAVLNEALHPT